jgi:hypothetical protein
VENIRLIAQKYGTIKTFKAYFDLGEQRSPKTALLRAELQSCGVSLTDCPHNNKKEVADKMILGTVLTRFLTIIWLNKILPVDMFTFALDTDAPAATIVLLSGDQDFTYAISILRMRNYRVVVVAPQQSHKNFKHRASDIFDWDVFVVGRKDTRIHGRRASDSACLQTNIAPSRAHSCAPSPSNNPMLSPLPKISRRVSVKEERSPMLPSPHMQYRSHPQIPTSDRAELSAIADLSDTASLLGSAVEDEGDLLLSASAPGKENETLPPIRPPFNIQVCTVCHCSITSYTYYLTIALKNTGQDGEPPTPRDASSTTQIDQAAAQIPSHNVCSPSFVSCFFRTDIFA